MKMLSRINLLWIAVFIVVIALLQSPSCAQEEEKAGDKLEEKEEDKNNTQAETKACERSEGECPNPDVVSIAVDPDPVDEGPYRLITMEEMEQNKGENNGKIYLSILGKVYDVTKGHEFYGPTMGYSVFAGRDGVVPFISGKFNEEEADKSTDVLTDVEMFQLRTSWVKFYREEKKYPFLGKLIGKYYDEKGEPTEELVRVFTRWRDYVPPPPKQRRNLAVKSNRKPPKKNPPKKKTSSKIK